MTDGPSWQPSARVFIRRSLILAVLTFLAFVLLMLPARAQFVQAPALIFLMPLAVTAIFLIEDYTRWRRTRGEHWEVEDGYLMHDGLDGRSMIPLDEIESAQKRFTGGVMLRLVSGQRLLMRYLENPDEVAQQINELRQAPLVHDSN